jgi:hypothetical protein
MFGERGRGANGMQQWHKGPILKEQLRPGSERTTLNETFRKTVELEIAKQTGRTSIALLKMKDKALWRGQPPPKRKKETAHRLTAGDVGAATTLRNFVPTDRKSKMTVSKLD